MKPMITVPSSTSFFPHPTVIVPTTMRQAISTMDNSFFQFIPSPFLSFAQFLLLRCTAAALPAVGPPRNLAERYL